MLKTLIIHAQVMLPFEFYGKRINRKKGLEMKSSIRKMFLFIGFAFAILINSEKTFANEKQVLVTLPTFDITINGHVIDNETRKYPFLVYKGITYFPMTYYDSRVLGLETSWSRENGLEIKKENVTSSYKADVLSKKNSKSYQASIRQGTLKLNEKIINNEKEDYPFLTLNQITYFPLTWRIAHDELGWSYEWNNQKGLAITSDNIQVKSLELPIMNENDGIALFQGNLYFTEKIGNKQLIYRTSDNQNKSIIYQYEVNPNISMNTFVGFRINEKQLLMNYLTGYTNNYVAIHEDGKPGGKYVKQRGSLDFRDTAYGKLAVTVGLSDEMKGNLHLIKENGTTQQVGNPDITTFGQSAVREGVTPTVVDGKDVYVLLSKDYPSPYVLYRIDLSNGMTTPVVENADWFILSNGELYFTNSSNKLLYKASKDGSGVMQLSDYPVTWFEVVNGNVFYTGKNNSSKLHLYKALEGKDKQILAESVSSVKVTNEQMLILPQESYSYGAFILDSNGQLLWKVADQISKLYSSDEGWLAKSRNDGKILFIR